MDLVTFLEARITEDEVAARAATPGGRWKVQPNGIDGHGIVSIDEHAYGLPDYPASVFDDESGAIGPGVPTMRHIARWDPARVLAECVSKRRIVEEAQRTWNRSQDEDPMPEGSEWLLGQRNGLRVALRALALPYADHPDYQPEWRPEETAHQ